MYYKVLSVSRKATQDEIKTSYRQLALRTHPDKCGGTEEARQRFQEIQKAYEVLGDGQSRAEYDGQLGKKREKLRGFVQPPPFDNTVSRPVIYRLANDTMYTFESSPDKVHCGLSYGDIISFNQQQGCFIGLAADNFLYWCRDGLSYASRMCERGSTFAMSSVVVLFRANINGGRVHLPPAPRRKNDGDGGKSANIAERMKAELRRKEKLKLIALRLHELVEQEEREREELSHYLYSDFLDLHGTLSASAFYVNRGVSFSALRDEHLCRNSGSVTEAVPEQWGGGPGACGGGAAAGAPADAASSYPVSVQPSSVAKEQSCSASSVVGNSVTRPQSGLHVANDNDAEDETVEFILEEVHEHRLPEAERVDARSGPSPPHMEAVNTQERHTSAQPREAPYAPIGDAWPESISFPFESPSEPLHVFSMPPSAAPPHSFQCLPLLSLLLTYHHHHRLGRN